MNVAIILAGGTGTRMGLEIPKQYYEVNGKAVISYCLHTFLTHEKIDAVQIVADGMWQEYIMHQLSVLPNRENSKGFLYREKTGSYRYIMRLRIFVDMHRIMIL